MNQPISSIGDAVVKNALTIDVPNVDFTPGGVNASSYGEWNLPSSCSNNQMKFSNCNQILDLEKVLNDCKVVKKQ